MPNIPFRPVMPLAGSASILCGALALASCAPVEEPAQETLAGLDTSRQCFFTREVDGFSDAPDGPEGQERLFVNTGPSEKVLLETAGPCLDIDFAQRIAIDNRFGGPSLCTGDTFDLLIPGGVTGTDRCLVRVVGTIEED